jgi:uncharacterized protein YlxW (UPF0749 family)
VPERGRFPPLLESLGRDLIDPGYAEAAARRAADAPGGEPARRNHAVRAAVLGITLAVAGALFGIAAGATEREQERQERARSALQADVVQAQARQDELAASASMLAQELRATQSQLGAGDPLQTVAELESAGGLTAVSGPGLRVVIDQAADAGGTGDSATGAIFDRDIQLLVNDLWAAGAEAVAVGGVRLRPTSSIRQAGGAILVDNRPVSWPIEIDAVGDPAAMHVALIRGSGYGRFSSFAQLYGVRFDVTAEPALTLPAGTANSDLRFAEPTGG